MFVWDWVRLGFGGVEIGFRCVSVWLGFKLGWIGFLKDRRNCLFSRNFEKINSLQDFLIILDIGFYSFFSSGQSPFAGRGEWKWEGEGKWM